MITLSYGKRSHGYIVKAHWCAAAKIGRSTNASPLCFRRIQRYTWIGKTLIFLLFNTWTNPRTGLITQEYLCEHYRERNAKRLFMTSGVRWVALRTTCSFNRTHTQYTSIQKRSYNLPAASHKWKPAYIVRCNSPWWTLHWLSLSTWVRIPPNWLKITTVVDRDVAAGPPQQQRRGVPLTPGTLPGNINQLNRILLLRAYLLVQSSTFYHRDDKSYLEPMKKPPLNFN